MMNHHEIHDIADVADDDIDNHGDNDNDDNNIDDHGNDGDDIDDDDDDDDDHLEGLSLGDVALGGQKSVVVLEELCVVALQKFGRLQLVLGQQVLEVMSRRNIECRCCNYHRHHHRFGYHQYYCCIYHFCHCDVLCSCNRHHRRHHRHCHHHRHHHHHSQCHQCHNNIIVAFIIIITTVVISCSYCPRCEQSVPIVVPPIETETVLGFERNDFFQSKRAESVHKIYIVTENTHR